MRNLKKIITIAIIVFLSFPFGASIFSQNVGINQLNPNPSAILDITATDMGLLIPRVALDDVNTSAPVTAPAEGLLIYNETGTEASGFYFWDGSKWSQLGAGALSNDWALLGNAGTVAGTNFLGTTDAQDLDIRTNNIIHTRITQKGQIETVNTGHSVFIGENAGENDDLTNNYNVFLGYYSGTTNTTGSYNNAFGYMTMYKNTIANGNTAIGSYALQNNETAQYNTAVGYEALTTQSWNNTGTVYETYNTAIGYRALFSNQPTTTTVGFANTAVGAYALESNVIGHSNTANGTNALKNNTTGYHNTAIGTNSLISLSTNHRNTAIGSYTLYNNTGEGNLAVGYYALYNNTSGIRNVASGAHTLVNNTTGGRNTANGYAALWGNTVGIYNTANGDHALYDNISGNYNTANGSDALSNNTTGDYNIANGRSALTSNTTGDHNIAIGYISGPDGSSALLNTIAIGREAQVTADNTTAIGSYAYANNANTVIIGGINGTNGATVDCNIGIGTTNPDASSLVDITSSTRGLLIPRVDLDDAGTAAPVTAPVEGLLIYNETGTETHGFYYWDGTEWVLFTTGASGTSWELLGNAGTVAGINFLGTTDAQDLDIRTNNIIHVRITQKGQIETVNTGHSVFIGENAGENDDFSDNENVFVGYNAGLSNTSGDNNIGLGYRSLVLNTTGHHNVASGQYSLSSNTTGAYNVASGQFSLYRNTTASFNTATGTMSLEENTTGVFNTGNGAFSLEGNTIGNYNTASGYTAFSGGTFSNSGGFGYDAEPGASNTIRLGNNAVSTIGGYANWTNVSDKRFKTNVQENVVGIDFIMKLRPITYNLDMDAIAEFNNTPDSLRLFESEKLKEAEIQSGFIAQEVEQVANELGYDFHGVDKPKNKTSHYGLRYAEFVVPLVKGMQEQQKIIEVQNQKIEDLIEIVNTQNQKIEEIENKLNE